MMDDDREHWGEALAIAASYRIRTQMPEIGSGEGWTAYVVELPGCDVEGETHVQVLAAAREAAAAWIAEALCDGRAIPPPRER